jgi:hypothetical protein
VKKFRWVVLVVVVLACLLLWAQVFNMMCDQDVQFFSGYGVLIGSKENAAGLGLQCTYLTARGTSTVQYLHTKSGFLGITDCPLLRKSNIVVDNG